MALFNSFNNRETKKVNNDRTDVKHSLASNILVGSVTSLLMKLGFGKKSEAKPTTDSTKEKKQSQEKRFSSSDDLADIYNRIQEQHKAQEQNSKHTHDPGHKCCTMWR